MCLSLKDSLSEETSKELPFLNLSPPNFLEGVLGVEESLRGVRGVGGFGLMTVLLRRMAFFDREHWLASKNME